MGEALKDQSLRRRPTIMTENQKVKIIKLRAAGYGYGKIAQQLGISVNTVKSFCRRRSINEDTATKSTLILSGEVTYCENCGEAIRQVKGQKRRKYCSDRCRWDYWRKHDDQINRKAYYTLKCRHCGKVFQVYGDRGRQYCSRRCYLEARSKGGAGHD
jgi:endogenous inhibitor of DNA gyrase (YacG/DUF329 family)